MVKELLLSPWGTVIPYASANLLIVRDEDRVVLRIKEFVERLEANQKGINGSRPALVFLDEIAKARQYIKDVLAPDGSVWVHLDEGEAHRARLLLDEVFGEAAYVATVCWRKKYKAGNANGIATVHNPILVYGARSGWRR